MRHVVLGATTPLGSAVVRMLISLGSNPIVAVSPSGEIPSGVNPNNIEVKFGDIVDAYSLIDIFQEDDIIYNTQVIFDESALPENAELYHRIGIINLLGIATVEKVQKVVCVLPQTTGWFVPDNANETTTQRNSTKYHLTIKQGMDILRKYWDGEEYGWKTSSLVKLRDDTVVLDQPSDKSDQQQPVSGPSLKSVPFSPSKSTSSGPKLPNLNKSNSNKEQDNNENDLSKRSENDKETHDGLGKSNENGKKTEKQKNPSQNTGVLINDTIEEMDRVSVVLLRLARQFGPYEEQITKKFCKATRLQRLTVVGKLNRPISWINPLDAARALIIVGDSQTKIENDQYNICGFTATPMEIIRSLEKINHSHTKVHRKSLFLERLKHLIMKVRGNFGGEINNQFYNILALNKKQVFDDSKARDVWDWEEKFGLDATTKEALKWFIHHVI